MIKVSFLYSGEMGIEVRVFPIVCLDKIDTATVATTGIPVLVWISSASSFV